MRNEETQVALTYWNEQSSTDKDLLCRLKYGEKKSYKRLTTTEIVNLVYNK